MANKSVLHFNQIHEMIMTFMDIIIIVFTFRFVLRFECI